MMFTVTEEQHEKLEALRAYLRQLGCVTVCFSGGVDSTLLLAVAHQELGEQVLAVTETNALYPQRETNEANDFCRQLGVTQLVLNHNPEQTPGFAQNPRNRCYICKLDLFDRIRETADAAALERGLIGSGQHIALVEGSNVSDLGDYRPGAQAVKEKGVLSPLLQAGMTKQDIRDLSREMGLPTWEKPSFACLASRFVYGETITSELLQRVDAAEQLPLDAGFRQVRVRMHDQGTMARVEVTPDRLDDAFAFLREGGAARLHELGFSHVSLDMDGYRTGSMNE